MSKKFSNPLLKLRQFCADPPKTVYGVWWFEGLVKAYPFQFLLYAQFANNLGVKRQLAKETIITLFDKKVNQILSNSLSYRDVRRLQEMLDELDKCIGLINKEKLN
jgi:hypothetical protein